MELPGGIRQNGSGLRRDFAFKPVTGEVEMAVAESGEGAMSLSAWVTSALTASLQHIGGLSVEWTLVHRLSVGDRQFLMRRLADIWGLDAVWLTSPCGRCKELFDIFIRQSELPTKPAGPGFPFASVQLDGRDFRLRTPNGEDQEAVAGIQDGNEAARSLSRRLFVDAASDQPELLSDEALSRIEYAVEAVAPEVATLAQADCPQCGQGNQVEVDPYLCLSMIDETLLSEIHDLAAVYHWSESEILALPRKRRRKYLQLVDGLRGVQRQVDAP